MSSFWTLLNSRWKAAFCCCISLVCDAAASIDDYWCVCSWLISSPTRALCSLSSFAALSFYWRSAASFCINIWRSDWSSCWYCSWVSFYYLSAFSLSILASYYICLLSLDVYNSCYFCSRSFRFLISFLCSVSCYRSYSWSYCNTEWYGTFRPWVSWYCFTGRFFALSACLTWF